MSKIYRVYDKDGNPITFTHTGIARMYLYAANASHALYLAKKHGHKDAHKAKVAA